jgi:hypothetical protein
MSIKTIRFEFQLLLGASTCFLIVGCNSPLSISRDLPLPQEVKNAAFDSVNKSSECKDWVECKNFTIRRIRGSHTYQDPWLTDADRENGVEERWIVTVDYIYRAKGGLEWSDGSQRFACERKNGVWENPCEFMQSY